MDNIEQWLIERKTIYSILALFYRGEIDKALEILIETDLLVQFSIFIYNEQLSIGANKIIEDIDENKNNNRYKELILDDYENLFVGPNDILAPLWESVYRTKDKLLFGDIELTVRQFYNSVKLDVKESEPADYLSLELSFMSRLCDMAMKDNFKNINENLIKQHVFLKDHLLSWISPWEDDVNKKAKTKFWRGLSLLTKGFLQNDLAEISEILEGIK
jgi:TorA maturation chaperone TorD